MISVSFFSQVSQYSSWPSITFKVNIKTSLNCCFSTKKKKKKNNWRESTTGPDRLAPRFSLLFSHSVVSDSASPWTAAHQASLSIHTSRSLLKSCPLSQWCHPTISSSVSFFSFCLHSFPASGSFPVSPLFASDGLNMRTSAAASVLPMNIQSWFPFRLTGLISLQSKGLSRVFSSTSLVGKWRPGGLQAPYSARWKQTPL